MHHLLARCTAILSLLFTFAALAQPAVGEGPALKVFNAWLAAFNSGDAAQYKAFDDAYKPARSLSTLAQARQQTGGFVLLRVESVDATKVVALLKEKQSENVARMELLVTADDPPKMVSARLNLVPPPPDVAPARLTQSEAVAALNRQIDESVRADQFSGAVLVAQNGKVLIERGAGDADRERNVPVSPTTKFRNGSMNKMFTSVATLQLIEAGKLALDDTVGKYLTDYPNKDIAGKVTIRQLLTHTGGTGDIFGPDYARERLNLKSVGDYVKLYGARAPLFAPGAEFRYSNYGYLLLGAIIEKVSGMSYYDYVQKHIYAVAGMTDTGSQPESEPVANRAVGYMERDGKLAPNTDTLPWRGSPAGGGYSTVGDMMRFANALQSGKLISKAMFAQATTPHLQGYGFGFGMRGEGDWKYFGHTGGAPGQNGELRIYPAFGYVVVALSNFDPPAAGRMVDFTSARLPATK